MKAILQKIEYPIYNSMNFRIKIKNNNGNNKLIETIKIF